MSPVRTIDRRLYRALATIWLACLVALGPALFAQRDRGVAGQPIAGWTICSSDAQTPAAPDTGGLPAHQVHHHCALCSALAAPIEPSPDAISHPVRYRIAANPARAGPVLSLKRAGWSSSWSSRAPPIDA